MTGSAAFCSQYDCYGRTLFAIVSYNFRRKRIDDEEYLGEPILFYGADRT